MNNTKKDLIITIEFIIILSTIFFANIIKKDDLISTTERRKLTQFPQITFETLLNGKAEKDFDKYAVDQFIFRDTFKEIKYFFSIYVMNQKDNNKYFVKDNKIYKIDYPINYNNIKKSAEKIEKVIETYLNNMNIYYCVIPDKNYYLQDEHLHMDISEIELILKEKIKNAKNIDIKNNLSLDSFYNTDLHWKQENLINVSNKIKSEMNNEIYNTEYETINLGAFQGTYYSQVGIKVKPDNLIYLNNNVIDNCVTYNYENEQNSKVYDIKKYTSSKDKYDLFISGPTPLISITNPLSNTKKELLLFRDSFGSSLAPLLLDSYSKITLIDLRYINIKLLKDYIDFNNQDVLFIYSNTVLNQNIIE